MAQRIDVPGMGVVEFPDDMDDAAITAAIQRNAPKQADPKLGKPEDLSFAEKYVAPVIEKPMEWAEKLGFSRGGWAGRVAKGASDPGIAAAQMVANTLLHGEGEAMNKAVAEREQEYQAARKAAGSDGVDILRAVGSAGILAPLGAGAGVVRGVASGAAAGALDPVREESSNFWREKAAQAGMGAATGAVMAPVMGALARVVSPKASVNENLDLLRKEGVQPTIGQSLGGWANAAEEKAMSLPIVGDAIRGARTRAQEQFQNATINRAVKPIGERVEGVGHEAIAEAGDKLSAAYQRALGSVNHVNFTTPTFAAKLMDLEQMATGLMPQYQQRFTRIIDDVIGTKMSPNGSILGADLKAIDSKLGKEAAKFQGTQDPFVRELGDAILQLKTVVMDQVRESAPDVASQLSKADKGWAWLVRAEGAAKKAVNNEGVPTPGQYNQAVREADKSVRKRAVARGEALGQDLGSAGQAVLGNRVADSGTAGRLGYAGLAGAMLAGGAVHAPLALGAGAVAYTPAVQNFLRYLVSRRPESAPAVANYLRELANPATVAAVPLLQEF